MDSSITRKKQDKRQRAPSGQRPGGGPFGGYETPPLALPVKESLKKMPTE